jgi:hypothetical protein
MNFDVYAIAIDEKFMFLGAKIGVILVGEKILDRLQPTLAQPLFHLTSISSGPRILRYPHLSAFFGMIQTVC